MSEGTCFVNRLLRQLVEICVRITNAKRRKRKLFTNTDSDKRRCNATCTMTVHTMSASRHARRVRRDLHTSPYCIPDTRTQGLHYNSPSA
jgi:hypothetical protein